MLHITNSLNFDALLDSFIRKIKSPDVWKDPFEPPLVVFSDIKVEKWFTLTWLKNSADNPILMNLHTEKLVELIFNSLIKGIRSEENIVYERISTSMIRNGLIQLLLSDCGGIPYYKSLKSEEVRTYIENEDGSINENRLYDFASTMANLFDEYETTRNDDFDKGISAKWKNDEWFFYQKDQQSGPLLDDLEALEKWQKKIYTALFTESSFTIRNEDFQKKYVTLSQLVKINKDSNNGNLTFDTGCSQIFIFGFSCMGNAYRSLLSSMAKDKEVYVYIQAKDCDFNNAKNPLLKKWNQTGSENLQLWQKSKGQNESCEVTYGEKGSLLQSLQKQISEDDFDSEILSGRQNDGTLNVTSVPSTLREIEFLHSSICSIIKQKKEAKEAVSYSDFVVLSPSIQDYKVPVMQVFDQTDKGDKNAFPHIPYVFADYSAEYSAIAEALKIFVSMLKKKALFRVDLFQLLRNPVIRVVKGYNLDQISEWSKWVSELNAYRDRESSKNEWKKLTRRLMLSHLTDNLVSNFSGDEIYSPYSNMESENSESLYKFVDAIDSLEKWISDFGGKTELNADDVESIGDFISDWLKISASTSPEFSGEKIVYSEIRSELEEQRAMFKCGCETINATGFFISLCNSAQSSKGSSNLLFTGGITFGDFSLNRTIPAKYVFILGLDSKKFPGVDSSMILDLRTQKVREIGDESVLARNKEAFLCQIMATGEKLFLSYVNADLQKDEEFFRSSVIDDLLDCIRRPDQKISEIEQTITLDEKRNWTELFSQREFRNKNNFRKLTETQETGDDSSSEESIRTYPDRVYLSSFKSFLKNPFVFRAKQLISEDDNDEAEEEYTIYEPLVPNALERTTLAKKLVIASLKTGGTNIEKNIDDIHKQMEIEGSISENIYGILFSESLKDYINDCVSDIKGYGDLDVLKCHFSEKRTLTINQVLENGKRNVTWSINGELCGYLFDEKKNKLQVFDFASTFMKDKPSFKKKYWLDSYLTALMLIASDESGKSYDVELNIYFNGSVKKNNFKDKVNSSDAQELLKLIYKKMYEEQFAKFTSMGIDITDIHKYRDFKGKALSDETWRNFSKKMLFNPDKDFGYEHIDDDDKFVKELGEAFAEYGSMLKFDY